MITVEIVLVIFFVLLAFVGFRLHLRKDVDPLTSATGFTLSMFSIVGILLALIDILRRI